MTVDSFFSQNFEDVLLERCFKDVNDGFYIDVGGQDEEEDSVTKFFYLKGWSGITIEPIPECATTFYPRTRDKVVCCAAGASNGKAKLTALKGSGLSSLVKENIINASHLGFEEREIEVDVRPLNEILEDLGYPDKQFEFLKVDVEGFELEVFLGIDLFRYRPKIILYEATTPCSTEKAPNTNEINLLLRNYSYEFLYFDGLNEWWGASEILTELKSFFSFPIGIWDGYSPKLLRETSQELIRTKHALELLTNNWRSRKALLLQLYRRMLN
ncbi:FkbM family methyltransferase [Synechococcus sp. CS-1324]|uniref:FkbM family methyltransferase n=1 Tax=Synechococcus sp. CS-1324 TaxID=2847980 RepID=UPI000DB0A28A|nr:FkbM family methyltransferase [Synechococcus sp. CS-1324]MCT0229476.1 FkbM family methyltransferase [Synechococcus sp. CS-1324]PZV04860.1 MAG: FkbM family methyltransferase [Cyanobium sp.]